MQVQKNELFLRYFFKDLFKVSEDVSYGIPPCIFAVVINRLCTAFLR